MIIKPGIGHYDLIITKFCLTTLSTWNEMNVTPNILTTFGLLSSVLCVYYLYKKELIPCIIFLLLRMYFDYTDGLLARKYNQTSEIGDYYDHIVDIFFFFVPFIFVLMLKSNNNQIILFGILLLVFGTSFVIQMGCIEKECGDECASESKSINFLKKYCRNPKFFKNFDNGFLYIILLIIIILYCNNLPLSTY